MLDLKLRRTRDYRSEVSSSSADTEDYMFLLLKNYFSPISNLKFHVAQSSERLCKIYFII